MGLFEIFKPRPRPHLEPDWMQPLPRRLCAPHVEQPRAFVAGPLVCAWGDGAVVAFDIATGAPAYRERIGGWVPSGFDGAGHLILGRGSKTARLDAETGAVLEAPHLETDPPRSAQDAPDSPDLDPTLRVGDRLFRVRGETRSRVTRHWIEIADLGHAPQRIEVAAFTLRSDRLTVYDRGGGRVYGWVGMDPESPAGAVVGSGDGPLLVLRRRFPAWHEHSIPVDEPDLIGHGPAHLNATIVVPGEPTPRGRELGTAPETWIGLGLRGGPHPPYLTRSLGARPVGLVAGKILVELTDLSGDSRAGWLEPRRRFLAAFSSADLLA